MPGETPVKHSENDFGVFGPLIDAIAARVVAHVRALLDAKSEHDMIDRKSCPYSKRWWDVNAGRTFTIFRDGRRRVAKRIDVQQAFESGGELAPRVPAV